MFFGLFVLGVSLVCGAFAQDGPSRCCAASQFTAKVVALTASLPNGTANPSIVDEYMVIEYDYDQMLERISGSVLDIASGYRAQYVSYLDYNTRMSYTVYDGSCTAATLPDLQQIMTPCVPDTFTNTSQYSIRSGDDSVLVNVWSGMYMETMVMSLHMTDADCTPVSLTYYGNTPDGSATLLNAYTFGDVKQGSVSSPDVFTMPDICTMAGEEVGK